MKIFFSVGEPSGDLHGANLIRELQARHQDCQCVGFGGPRMAAAGLRMHADLTKLAVMWFLRVILNVHRFYALLREANSYFRQERPDAVILIDYPGFNWWVARCAKAHNIPVFYYGAPQMWAWAAWRIRKMRRLVDHVLCKLPFEADWYRERGCNAQYIGHPYFDETNLHDMDQQFVSDQARSNRPLLTLLPGSRTQETKANLPTFLKVAEILHQLQPELRIAVASFNASQADAACDACAALPFEVAVHVGRTPELIQSSTICLACSGSVSLELLHHLKPTVIHYKISRAAFRVQKYFRRVKFITLVNLLSTEDRFCRSGEQYDANQDEVPFPEYLTCIDRSQEMANHLVHWLNDEAAYASTVGQLKRLKDDFAKPGASATAADYILSQLSVSNTLDGVVQVTDRSSKTVAERASADSETTKTDHAA